MLRVGMRGKGERKGRAFNLDGWRGASLDRYGDGASKTRFGKFNFLKQAWGIQSRFRFESSRIELPFESPPVKLSLKQPADCQNAQPYIFIF